MPEFAPLDYTSGFATVQQPIQAIAQGYQLGSAIRGDQLAQQQQALAMAQQQQQALALQRLMANPNPSAKDYADITVMVPGLREQFKQAWDMRSADQQQAALGQLGSAFSALATGRPDIAEQQLRDQAAAFRNSGNDRDAANAEAIADTIKTSPKFAQANIGAKLAWVPGGDKVIKSVQDTLMMPSAVSKSEADASKAGSDATIAGVAAGNAPTATVLGNQKTAQEIRASQLSGKIAELNAQIGQANSETERGRLVLERDKFVAEQAKLGQQQSTGAQDAMDSLTQALETVKAIKAHPGITGLISGAGSKAGPLVSLIPGTDRHDLDAMVATLKSQQFLASIKQMSGMGALSNAEGDRLAGAVASLDTNQSEAQFRNALQTVDSLTRKGQAKLVAQGNLPTTGGAFVMKHPVYGNVTEGSINALMRQFPGSTRAQILNFLQSTGGQ